MGPTGDWQPLDGERAAAAAPLIGQGCRSGDALLGLSAVRQAKGLALILADAGLAAGSRRQLGLGARRGTRLYLVEDLEVVTASIGRPDVRVIGVRRGPLARGILAKWAP